MSIEDFDSCTPDEFGAILKEWRREQTRSEAAWLAGIRLHAAITIQPHCKKRLRPADLFAIPDIDNPGQANRSRGLTREERRQRFEDLKKLRGYE
jgi:hypothetical protein